MQGDLVKQKTLNLIRVCQINVYVKLRKKLGLAFTF